MPLGLVEPFDKAYKPQDPVGRAAIRHLTNEWSEGRFTDSWVYEKYGKFILSDNYIVYYAAQEGQPDYLPCWILGSTRNPEVKDLQGPLDIAGVREALGI